MDAEIRPSALPTLPNRRFSLGAMPQDVQSSPVSGSHSLNGSSKESDSGQKKKKKKDDSKRTSPLPAKDQPNAIPQPPVRRLSLGRDTPVSVPGPKSPLTRMPSPGDKHVIRRRTMTTAGRDGRAIAGPDWRGQDDTRLDLRAQMIRSLDSDLVNLTGRLEFVYLRDNKISSLEGIQALKKVKVLDLCFNELRSASMQPLSACKNLQQLYLAGNGLTALDTLPRLPSLEFLSVAQNNLEGLSFVMQPRLQVLAATKNAVSGFKGFAVLPNLVNLRLEENPILEASNVLLAAKVLTGPSLTKFNDQDIAEADMETAERYPAHAAMCIREGWSICPPEEAEESILQFLQTLWAPLLPPLLTLKRVYIDSPQEEEVCHCEFLLESPESRPALRYQWFRSPKGSFSFTPLEGETGHNFKPGYTEVGCFLRVEITVVIKDQEFGPFSLVTPPVNRGSGVPHIASIQISGDPVEGGVLKGHADVAWCSGTPGKSVASWWRCRDGEDPVLLEGFDGSEYELTLDDVGFWIEFGFTPVNIDKVSGEMQRARTGVVRPAVPTVHNLELKGEPISGHLLSAAAEFRGGKEGESRFQWFRERGDTSELIPLNVHSRTYKLKPDDVGHKIVFHYTPISVEGLTGQTVATSSGPISYPHPEVTDVGIEGQVVERGVLRVSGRYYGGVEGASRVRWFKTKSMPLHRSDLVELKALGSSKELLVPLEAVDHFICVEYTPVRSDKVVGHPVLASTATAVAMLPPSIESIHISGDMVEGGALAAGYIYSGGHEGASTYGWFRHKDPRDPGSAIKQAQNVLKYTLRLEDVGHLISFRCSPVRSDGVQGDMKAARGSGAVVSGPPVVSSLRILGDPVEGQTLTLVKDYRGGIEGASIFQWHKTHPDGTKDAIRGATSAEYVVRSSDLDCLLSVTCVPVRSDGKHGQLVASPLHGPIAAASPRCVGLQIVGKVMEGHQLSVESQFRGGERGQCIHKWYRQDSDGTTVLKGDRESVLLSYEDVGSRILLTFTPVRDDGVVGEVVSTLSDPVEPGDPTVVDLQLPERLEEGIPVDIIRRYSGGQEGEGKWAWFRSLTLPCQPVQLKSLQKVAYTRTYTPTLEDVDKYLVLEWTPERQDGKVGTAQIAFSENPVAPGWPLVRNVSIRQLSSRLYEGSAQYQGGLEGHSICSWFRRLHTGAMEEIDGASGFTYTPMDADYACRLVFGYTPRRSDGMTGVRVLSQPSGILLPELPTRHGVTIVGSPCEGETLFVAEIVDEPWENFKKESVYQWFRGKDRNGEFELLPHQRDSKYEVRLEDVGYFIRCTCVLSDIYGRTAERVESVTGPVLPGKPHVENLYVEGSGYHTSTFTVRGEYIGGNEGSSEVQWYRARSHAVEDLELVIGECERTYEASADDVGYMLMAKYVPVRDDGVVGEPVTSFSDYITIEPSVAADVSKIVDLGSAKFETQQQGGTSALERRVVDVNRKRIKVIRPGFRLAYSNIEVRGSYDPPFKVILSRDDPYLLRIRLTKDSEVELVLHSRHARDVIALAIRRFAELHQGA